MVEPATRKRRSDEPGIGPKRLSRAEAAHESFADQDGRGLDANTALPSQPSGHRLWDPLAFRRRECISLALDGPDLVEDEL